MNLFLDIVRRNERLMNNNFTEDDLNRELRPTAQLLGVTPPSNIGSYNPNSERRSNAGNVVIVFIFIQL